MRVDPLTIQPTLISMEPDRLQQLHSLLKLLERTAFIGVWTLELGLDRLDWSEQLAVIHDAPPGFTPARADAFALYAPEWREQVAALVRVCAAAGEPFDEEMQIVTLRGRRAWVRTIGHAVRDETGKIVRVEGAVQEIAPQGHRAGTLSRHTFSMGGAMGGGEAFATVDREGRFTYVNEQAERLLGRVQHLDQGRTLVGVALERIVYQLEAHVAAGVRRRGFALSSTVGCHVECH